MLLWQGLVKLPCCSAYYYGSGCCFNHRSWMIV